MSIKDQIIIARERIKECEEEILNLDLVVEKNKNNLELRQIFQDTRDDLEDEISQNKKFITENGEIY